ncbi:MAG: class I SAM-dependent methyltransferase, partial [Gammaproteobacteria bacterium]|nr:class I SAM-dependent methyltransferase [Gammaproteobacteria bacterium]
VILFVGSLHHVTDLDGMLRRCCSILKPDGILVVNEYIGPCYIVLHEQQVNIVNKVLSALGDNFKLTPNAKWTNPSIETVMATDPSEAVRSALIPSFLDMYFDLVKSMPYGGSLLHPLFQLLNSNTISNDSPECQTVIDLLITIEDILIENGVLNNDFVFNIYQQRQVNR